ncbi:MAG: tetratricopeptide repeat-containing protein kinase family protein, partial [Planctomycetota bacterium]
MSVIETRRSGGSDVAGAADGSSGSETQMGSVMGTPAYMPPEQALGEIDQLNQRSDVFGLGAILCEILTGQPPYVAENATAVFRMAARGRLDEAFKRLEESAADPELIALTHECLAAEPAGRPSDAGIVAERVVDYLESVETKLRDSELKRASEATRLVEQKKRLRVTLVLASTLLLALGLGISGTSWYAYKATAARAAADVSADNEREAKQRAEKRLEQSQKANEILASIFRDLDPDMIATSEMPLQAILAMRLDTAVEELRGESVGDSAEVARLQHQFGGALLSLGYPEKAIDLLSQAVETLQKELGGDAEASLHAESDLANAYQDAGDFDRAISILRRILESS